MTHLSADLKIELGPIEQLGVARGPKGTSVVRITSKMTFSRGGLTWVRPVETFVLLARDGNMFKGQHQRREDADDELKKTDGPEGDGPEDKYEKDEFELENPMDIDRAKEGIPSILKHDESGSLLHGRFALSLRGMDLPTLLVLELWAIRSMSNDMIEAYATKDDALEAFKLRRRGLRPVVVPPRRTPEPK